MLPQTMSGKGVPQATIGSPGVETDYVLKQTTLRSRGQSTRSSERAGQADTRFPIQLIHAPSVVICALGYFYIIFAWCSRVPSSPRGKPQATSTTATNTKAKITR